MKSSWKFILYENSCIVRKNIKITYEMINTQFRIVFSSGWWRRKRNVLKKG